jgi:type III restriction enzyme
MNRHVNAIAGRLSLRPPQRRSLEILNRITKIAPPKKGADVQAALDTIRSEFPSVTDFEREFPSLCFALATGVGKTRLMGAFIAYLHLARGLNNFFVLAPNLTIYNKLIADFTPNTAKYVFKGIAEFATNVPYLITGDTYEQMSAVSRGALPGFDETVRVNVFNISKINSEVRGGKLPKIKRMAEIIGESYFAYLAGLNDLVLLMDESHRYRASAGVRAINELKPVLGLELTATPFVEGPRGPVAFKNIIFDYALGKAMTDGFVKEPAVVTRKNFNSAGMSPEEIERLKLEDGVRLHEQVKVQLETYARETEQQIVKPFVLVIARDTTHAAQLVTLIQSDGFFEGRYKDRVIQVDSSKTGAEEDRMIEDLLKVEQFDSPTEIVIHVNMLKEGWDVTNLYTIVPLRAANARILIEQSIGRGLRLPYGKRTGVAAVDRLNIVAHDRFQEIVDDAKKSDSPLRLQTLVLDADELTRKTVTVVSRPLLDTMLGIQPSDTTSSTKVEDGATTHAFTQVEDERVAQIARNVIRNLENQPKTLPSLTLLSTPAMQTAIVQEVTAQYRPSQLEMEAVTKPPDIAAIVAKTSTLITRQTIDIPRILVVPRGETKSGFKPFTLDLKTLRYQPLTDELWAQYLASDKHEVLTLGKGGIEESRLEDYVVSGLVDFDDISYDAHADFLYELAGQTVAHLRGYLGEEDIGKVLRCCQCDIANFIHAQMQAHYWEETEGVEVKISKGFTALKQSAYSAVAGESPLDFRVAPSDKSNMARYLFGGFTKCLYAVQKFQSDTERKLAVILEREALKWFKPAKGQFQIYYKSGADHPEYQPDFVAETASVIYMLEPKARNELKNDDVLAKKAVAEQWCDRASEYAKSYGGKPWQYALIPHDAIAENMTIKGLAAYY